MAFHWQTFRTRALTAIIFVAVMLTGLLWNRWSFLALFSIIHFGCWWEYLRLVEKIRRTVFHPYIKLGFMILGYSLVLWFCGPEYRVKGYGLQENLMLPVSAAGFVLLVLGIFQKIPVTLRSFATASLGIIYISLSWGMLMDLKSGSVWIPPGFFEQVENQSLSVAYVAAAAQFPVKNTMVCLLLVFTVWVNDTMAYIVGSFIGKTPFSKISPRKTWEGTIGGIILAVAVMGLIFSALSDKLFDPENKFSIASSFWYIIAAIAAVSGTIGDLLESKLKRMAGVKDSGHLMPGHGGFLDRFDSLLLAIPFAWVYIKLVTL